MHHDIHIAVDVDVIAHIMVNELKVGVIHMVGNVLVSACQEIIYRNNPMTFCQKTICKMRPDKPSAASDDNTHVVFPFFI
jgi:hypothetical protein